MPGLERLHSLDAVRGFALLLGIVLHATMSFFLPIPALDSSQSETLAVSFYVIHIFRMSLFYFVAGFFAHMVFHRRGLRAFAKDRAKRILVPMIGGWLILAPLTIVVIIWGVGRTFGAELPPGAEQQQNTAFPLTHLWFLYYLCIFYLVAIAARQPFAAFIDRSGRIRQAVDALVRAVLPGYLAPWLLAVPLVAVLYFDTGWELWAGIPTPDTGLTPKLPAMIGFGTAFVAGWLLHRQADLLQAWERRWQINLAIAVALSAVCLWMVDGAPDWQNPVPVELTASTRLLYAACYAAAIWYWSFGIIGVAIRFCSGASPLRRYLADSSYWLYLAHLPVVFFLQVVAAPLPWHWTIKFPLILGITMSVLLVSYHYLVRPTFIGEILNGRKYPRRQNGHAAQPPNPKAPGPVTPGPGGSGPGPHDPDQPGRNGESSGVAVLEGVSKSFGETLAVDNLSLNIRDGELLAVLGPNGAGKSTAISLWLGMLEPDEGSVTLMGGSPFEPEHRLRVGMMLQDVNLTGELRAKEIIALAASYYPDPMSVDEAMALTHTAELAGKRYKNLSSGQKRQVQFATAVCGRPKLLFLDEPTVGLDIEARETMWRTIRSLLANGCSIVLTTHYLEEAEALADRVAILSQGRLISEGSVDEMRSIVTRRQISCASSIPIADIESWPGVIDASRDADKIRITATDAESVVRRLLAADEDLHKLEVRQASLAEAFTELTREAA